jgi:hypothetical protein
MHFSEDDLRNALKRHDPGANFTRRVMAGIGINHAEAKAHAGSQRRSFFSTIFSLARRPALAGAMAVLALAVGAGLGYRQHLENEKKRAYELAMAKEAERQAIVALRIANAKLNRVFQRVRESQQNEAQGSKIRRERL